MVDHCIYNLLDNVLPYTDRSSHDIFRLEYISACKLMENEDQALKILTRVPTSMFEPLLQSVIYKCYLEFINIDNMLNKNIYNYAALNQKDISIPESLGFLILNWPHEEFILRNHLPPLNPPVERFPSHLKLSPNYVRYGPQNVCQIQDMIIVFRVFCNKLIKFITSAVFKCTPRNTHGFSCKLRTLDVSGLGCYFNTQKSTSCFPQYNDIINVIRNSTINTFGHKIDILGDAEMNYYDGARGYYAREGNEFDILRTIIKESLNPDVGISLYFKEFPLFIDIYSYKPGHPNIIRKDIYNILALGKCEYFHLTWNPRYGDGHKKVTENLYKYLPELVGIRMASPLLNTINLDFLSAFKCLEQVTSVCNNDLQITNSICNLSNGLKYLNLSRCYLSGKDLECLANSKHADTLLELNLTGIWINDDETADGLIILCQKLKIVKVLIFDFLHIETRSSELISKIFDAINDCDVLDFLSLKGNRFSLEETHIVVDGLSQNKLLRYLGLTFPVGSMIDLFNGTNENIEYLHNLCKIFHEKLNKLRHSPLYISWSK
ncbi:unnamed protein product [Meganyctiphanes norvegica]|uniref:Uncharacterized protein n=1 Tax=Meganyctiphanes norvegica TaxID=48144 RepID=A0AAV2PXZ0_MEGNR